MRDAKVAQFGLDRIRLLDNRLGSPHAASGIIHVAGTKGKGSTAAMIAAGLSASGYRTGLYTSPHVTGLRERIQIDGVPISREAFAACLTRIAECVPDGTPDAGRPTFFEILTETGFLHFAAEKADWAVIEVGLGGRLDATNIVAPRAAVLTPIGLDHQEILGATIGLIAAEKAGILKPGVPAVSAPQQPEAAAVIAGAAGRLGVPLHLAPDRPPGDLPLAMPGPHQRVNAATALATLDLLERAGEIRLRPGAVREALSRLRLPGRIERIAGSPEVIVDGAHNRDSIDALLAALREGFSGRRIVGIFACQKDKEASWMLGRFAPACAALVVTTTGNPRAVPAEELSRLARAAAPDLPVEAAPTPADALARAKTLAGPDGLVCATGSLYLAGAIRRELLGDSGTD